MWKGKVTEELIELHKAYFERYNMEPDEYIEILYDGMAYDEYVGYIQQCLQNGVQIPEVVK